MMTGVEKIANLECIMVRSGKKATRCVVLLHGYGASFEDLAPLSEVLSVPSDVDWIFPNGPIEIALGWMMSGRAWFHIDMAALNEAMMRGTHRNFSDLVPEGFLEASDMAKNLIDEVSEHYSSVIVGGFSQGAMVSCDAVFRAKKPVAGLCLLSGNLVAKSRLSTVISPEKCPKVFQSHGESDPVLSFASATDLKDLLVEQGVKVEFHPFKGQHEIPQDVCDSLGRFITHRFKDSVS